MLQRFGARLLNLWAYLRSSYGFIPALMTAGAVVLAIVAVQTPAGWGDAVSKFFGLPPTPEAEAQRELMGMLASATIGTGAVAFSVIVAATVNAAAQYGPRLLTNFLADRATQVTIGVFVATFVYCMLIYASVRPGAERGLAGLIGMCLAFASIVALIYFLHHAPAQLRINQVIADIGRALLRNIDTRFPANCGRECTGDSHAEAAKFSGARPGVALRANEAGFLSLIDGRALANIAAEIGVVLVLAVRPGAFVTTGQPLATVAGGAPTTEDLDRMRNQFAIAAFRTPAQDNDFFADELVEIALRALSPGVNDPVTATACLAWLGAAIGRLASAPPPSPYRCGDDGSFRFHAQPLGFESYLERSFGRIRQFAAGNIHAAEGFFRGLATIAIEGDERALSSARAEADRLLTASGKALQGADFDAIQELKRRFERAISAEPPALDEFYIAAKGPAT